LFLEFFNTGILALACIARGKAGERIRLQEVEKFEKSKNLVIKKDDR
jgi:hypothetical protein